ncbi:MAG: serine/threonine protein kinase [Rhodospirillales bacterium]|nr:serine/threonine protein kinase [Rhodospirillales bacterium]
MAELQRQGKDRYFAEGLLIQDVPTAQYEQTRQQLRDLVQSYSRDELIDQEARAPQDAGEGFHRGEPQGEGQAPEGAASLDSQGEEKALEDAEPFDPTADELLGGEPPDEVLGDELTAMVSADTARAMVGKILSGRYKLGEQIGQGVSHVWLATELSIDEPCVVKAVVGERKCVRLRREVHFGLTCKRVPGIVRVLSHGQDSSQGIGWFVMDYVDGMTLGQRIEQGGVLGWEEAVRIGRQAAETLAGIHAHHIIHRDIKPSNVFLGRTGEVWVLDLGIAKGIGKKQITENGRQLLGTVPFLAPEQYLTPADVDVRADVYALGQVLCYALGGEAALPNGPAADYDEFVAKRRKLGDVMPSLPKALVDVLERACHPDPAKRYQTMAEFLRALLELLEAPKRAAEAEERAKHEAEEAAERAKLRRHRRVFGGLAAGFALGMLALGFGLPHRIRMAFSKAPAKWALAEAREKLGLTTTAAKTL